MRLALLKVARFSRRPIFVKLWILPVWLMLGIAKLLVFNVSFRHLLPFLGKPVGVAPWIPLSSEEEESRARMISSVVSTAARFTPWDSNCFPQAIVARVLLGLYGVRYCLYFGIRKVAGEEPFDAHTWIATGRVAVVGRRSFRRYIVVGVFASPVLARSLANELQDFSGRGSPDSGGRIR